ncbi:hypothetical protein [Klebsiella quasivariicola]|uniref:hypothetical protein n=1 Tax=Klebsiella quasivariicola TaxID=2026240 RepID=UPI0024793791|nr:hypothetical protein [Klebsiella quasivariicola]
MAVQDIMNQAPQSYDLTSGQYTPSQVAQGYQYYQDAQDMQGLGTSPVVNTGGSVDLLKAKQAASKLQQDPLGLNPPTNKSMFTDMLKSLLIGFAASALLGGGGKAGLAIGLLAAGGTHDADLAEMQRYKALKEMVAKGENYSPVAMQEYMKTGNDKALTNEYNQEQMNIRQDAQLTNRDTETEKQIASREKIAGDNLAQRREAEQDRINHPVGSAMNLVDNDGYLSGHGQTAAKQLAQQIWSEKSSFIKPLQTRMSKLASAEGMKQKVQDDLARGDYTAAQSDYNLFVSDLAQAEKGGNAAISDAERKQVNKIGSILNQIKNGVRDKFGYTPNGETMDSVFNTFQNVTDNDKAAIHREILDAAGLNDMKYVRPEVKDTAADILLKGDIGSAPVAAAPAGASVSTGDNTSAVNVSNSQMVSFVGQSTSKPDGYTVSNGRITLVAKDGKWTMQD